MTIGLDIGTITNAQEIYDLQIKSFKGSCVLRKMSRRLDRTHL